MCMKMKRIAAAILAALAVSSAAYAAEPTDYPVPLCEKQPVTAVDFCYRVAGGNAPEVLFGKNGLYASRYEPETGLLRVSIASAEPLMLAEPLFTIRTDGTAELESLLVNGEIETNPVLAHTPKEVPAAAPTCDKDGRTAGSICEVCGIVLKEQQSIPATGPVVQAALAEDGVLTVHGMVCDNESDTAHLLFAVYDADGRLLQMSDLSGQPRNAVSAAVENCGSAAQCKLFRLSETYAPVYSAVVTVVK